MPCCWGHSNVPRRLIHLRPLNPANGGQDAPQVGDPAVPRKSPSYAPPCPTPPQVGGPMRRLILFPHARRTPYALRPRLRALRYGPVAGARTGARKLAGEIRDARGAWKFPPIRYY